MLANTYPEMLKKNNYQEIAQHYQSLNLIEKIEFALAQKQQTLSAITLHDLESFDEMHIGGKAASRSLGIKAQLQPGSLVLDVGSGLGGPARLLAHEFGLQVIGLDVTASYCQLADKLTTAVGVNGVFGFINGNALQTPFKDDSLDAVWTQHCAMNIKEKLTLYQEFARILKPEGKFLIHDIVAGQEQPVFYPTPWASTETNSFLETPSNLNSMLQKAGFQIAAWEDITSQAFDWYDSIKNNRKTPQKTSFLQNLAPGETLQTMNKNVKKNLYKGRIKVIEAICIPAV